MLCGGLAQPTQWAATMDLSGGTPRSGFAIMNMAGNLGAIALPDIVGHLFDTSSNDTGGDWNSCSTLIAGIYLAAADRAGSCPEPEPSPRWKRSRA